MLVQNHRIPEFRVNQSPITIDQYGAFSSITVLFSRAIQWIKDLVQSMCSCGKKPLAITATHVSGGAALNQVFQNIQPPQQALEPRAAADIQPPQLAFEPILAANMQPPQQALEQRPIANIQPPQQALEPRPIANIQPPQEPILAADIQPPQQALEQRPAVNVQPPPAPADDRAIVDLDHIVQRPLREDDDFCCARASLLDVNLRFVKHERELAKDRAEIEQLNARPPEQRNEILSNWYRSKLETADARLVALHERRIQLYAFAMPQEFWDRLVHMSAAEVAAALEEAMNLIRQHCVAGDPRLVSPVLDRIHAEIEELEEMRLAFDEAQLPVWAQGIRRENLPVEANNVVLDRARIERILAMERGWIAGMERKTVYKNIVFMQKLLAHLDGIPDRLIPPDHLFEVQYTRINAEAKLAALQSRLVKLQTMVLPRAFWDRLNHMNIAQVDEELRGLLFQIDSLSQFNGDVREMYQDEIDEHCAKVRALQDYRGALVVGQN